MLPLLFKSHNARSLYDGPVTWVVVTSDAEFLKRIGRVAIDNLNPDEFLQFFDDNDVKLENVPQDIIALYNQTGSSAQGAEEPKK